MRIAMLLASHGGTPLTIGIERGLRQMGHEVVNYETGRGYDLILVCNQANHRVDYAYPEFPPESDRTPIAFIDGAEYGWTKRVHEPVADYWNAFSSGSMAHDTKVSEQQERLRHFLEGRSFPYFLREFWSGWPYPTTYHPIDFPLYAASVCMTKPSLRAYMARPIDLSCIWGLSNPWRVPLTQEMRSSDLHKDVYVIEQDGPRIPQFGGNGYFRRIEQSKSSVNFDGYGCTTFRLTEVLCRTLLLQGPFAVKMHAQLEHGVNCWAFCIWVDGEHYVRSNLIEQAKEILGDPRRAYRIYEAGYHHCMTHLTEKATAVYVLRTVEAHDWSKATAL